MQKIILRDIAGREKSVYLDAEHNLCIEKSNNEKEIIFKNCSGEFEALQSEMGKIHIVLQDNIGNLFYLLYSEEKWLNFSLLKSKTGSCSFSGIRIFDIGGNLNLFYTLKYSERYLLIHQKIDFRNEKKPNVLDYVYNGKYSVFSDNKGNVYIVYQNELKRIFCRIYNEFNGGYTPKMLDINGEPENFCGVCGVNSNPYISYIVREKTHYSVVFYDIKENYKKTIGFGTDSMVIPYMYCNDNVIFVTWKERYNCYKCFTRDFGKSFSKTSFLGKNAINTIVKNCASSFEYI